MVGIKIKLSLRDPVVHDGRGGTKNPTIADNFCISNISSCRSTAKSFYAATSRILQYGTILYFVGEVDTILMDVSSWHIPL